MNRIDRLVAIVIFLQSKKIVRGKEIATHFEISLRTVYRDINALCEAGIPIAAEPGEGYSIVEGYHLPPVMFTPDEAKALVTGAKLAEHMTDASLIDHARSALMKINSVLPDTTRDNMERLHDLIALLGHNKIEKDFRNDVLLMIQDAIVDKRVLKMEYYVASRDDWTTREIEPLGLIYYSNRWHLYAWCRKRKDIRDFRTDRIRSILQSEEIFRERPGMNLKEYMARPTEIDNPVEVQIQFHKRSATSVRERFIFGIIEEKIRKDHVILTFISHGFKWLLPTLLSLSPEVKVLKPKELMEALYNEAQKIVNIYKKDFSC